MKPSLLFIALFAFLFSACQPKAQTPENNTDTAVQEQPAPPAKLNRDYFLPMLGLDNRYKDQGISAYINAASSRIVPGQIQNGEGLFYVYKIFGDDDTELAHIFCIENDAMVEIPHYIEIISPKISTPKGIKVGDSYAKLVETYGEVTLIGSEMEGRTHAYVEEVQMRISAYNPEIKGATAEPDDTILSIAFFL
jgi:hypothetical protein